MATVQGRGVPITSDSENKWGHNKKRQRLWEIKTLLLKGPTYELTCFKLRNRGSGSKSVWELQGETKLTSFSARAGGARIRETLSGDESANRFHCSLQGVSFHPTRPAQEGTKSVTLH